MEAGINSFRSDELKNDVFQLLMRSNFGTLLSHHKTVMTVFEDADFVADLDKFKSAAWDFEDVEIITSIVIFWTNNYPEIAPDNRKAIIDILREKFNLGSYDLMNILFLHEQEQGIEKNTSKRSIRSVMRPTVDYWRQIDPYNYLNIYEQFKVRDDFDEVEKEIWDMNPYKNSRRQIESAWYYYYIGRSFYNFNQFSQGEFYVDMALEIAKTEPVMNNLKGLITLRKEDYNKAQKFFDLASHYAPNAAVYLSNAGLAYQNDKKYDLAIDRFLKAIEKESDGLKKAEYYNYAGITFYEQAEKEKYERAVSYYKEAIEHNSKVAIYYNNLGLAYQAMGEYANSIVEFTKALELEDLEDKQAEYHNYIGVAYHSFQKYTEAIDAYKKANELDPKQSLYSRNMAIAYNQLQKRDLAVKYYEKAADKEENPVERAYDHNAIGLIYSDQFKDTEALKHYKIASELMPSIAVFYQNIGFSYRYLNAYDEAIDAYKKALNLTKKDKEKQAYYLNQIGLLLTSQNLFEESLKYFSKAVSRFSKHLYHNDYGKALLNTGKCTEAKKQFQKAVDLGPEISEYKRQLEELDC